MNLNKLLRNHWDRTAAVVVSVLGLAALYLGWNGVSQHTLATEQLPYIVSGGLLSVYLLGVGATLWLSADLRDSWRTLREVNRTINAQHDGPDTVDAAEAPPAGATAASRNGVHEPVPAPSPSR